MNFYARQRAEENAQKIGFSWMFHVMLIIKLNKNLVPSAICPTAGAFEKHENKFCSESNFKLSFVSAVCIIFRLKLITNLFAIKY